MNVRWSPTAIGDLVQIRAYIGEHDPAAAAGLAETLLAALEKLREIPESGRPGRLPETRELVIAGTPLTVPYRVLAGRMEIIAVLLAVRKWPPGPQGSQGPPVP